MKGAADMEENRKNWIWRIISGAVGAFFLIFGSNIGPGRFCLGDRILTVLGLPVWSKGTQGLHYAGVIGIVGALISFWFFAGTTKDPKKTIAWLLVGYVVFMKVLDMLL